MTRQVCLAMVAVVGTAVPVFAGDRAAARAAMAGPTTMPTMPTAEESPAVVRRAKVVRGSMYQAAAEAAVVAGSVGSEDPEHHPAVPSFTYVEAPENKKWKAHDLVTVIVREDSGSTSTGKSESKKTQDFDMQLKQFLELGRFGGTVGLGNVSNPAKLPEVAFSYNNNRQADATQQRQDTVTTRLEASVVDVKPNGTLVIQATRHIKQDREEQTFKLTGVCAAKDITPDGTILSTQIADMNFEKSTRGDVREGTKNGWLNRIIDKLSPF